MLTDSKYTTEQVETLRHLFLEVATSDFHKDVSRVIWKQNAKRMRLIELSVLHFTGNQVTWGNEVGARIRISFNGLKNPNLKKADMKYEKTYGLTLANEYPRDSILKKLELEAVITYKKLGKNKLT